MCTALNLTVKDHYFGRNLDLDRSLGEQICILPRNYPLHFCRMGRMDRHNAMIGMALVLEGEALYYDAVNEKGLCMAGLNFPGNAYYHPERRDKNNISPSELIPWVLAQCATLQEARTLLEGCSLADIPLRKGLPLSPLHWIVSGREGSLVVESMKDGLHIYGDPVGVLTNNPPFPYQLFSLNNYRALDVGTPENRWDLDLDVYCQGLGGLGLPGDLSSMSRFVRGAFYAGHSVCQPEEAACVSQVFHLMGAVEMPRGGCRTENGTWDITVYSACINADLGRYYYTTYGNRRITCVDIHRADLEGTELTALPLKKEQDMDYQN